MAFKKEDLKKIADLLKIKAEDLEAVATATDEKAIEIPEVHTFSEDELKTVKANEYKSGKTAGVEIAVKEAREKMGLEFQGKTIDGLLEAHSKKVLADAKIDQSEQVKQLNDKIATLQNTVKTQESAIVEKENQVKQVFAKAEFAKHVPALGENGPALGTDDVMQLMKASGYDFKVGESGKLEAWKDGKIVQDKLSNPENVGTLVSGFLKEKKLIVEEKQPGGRGPGGGAGGATKFSKLSELKALYKEQGKSELGQEFREEAAKLKAENPDFDLNS